MKEKNDLAKRKKNKLITTFGDFSPNSQKLKELLDRKSARL